MLTLRKVAVTGGLSSGKSSACRFFKELGAYTVSADEIVHQLLSPYTALGQQVINLLGKDILVNDQIDRSKVAKKVFNEPSLLHSLEKLLHPAVISEIERQYQKASAQGKATLFVAEIPLLFEIGSEAYFDFIVAVHADSEICRHRFKAATGLNDHEYDRRMTYQMPSKEKARRADYVLNNNHESPEELRHAVEQLYRVLTSSIDS
jgi:dephospho-CoA kinase